MAELSFAEIMQTQIVPVLQEHKQSWYFYGYDNAKIYYEYYIHPEEKASIVIVHGFCEFCEKYEEVIYTFYQMGYSVFVLDHRGHGKSARAVKDLDKVHIKSYQEYVEDLYVLLKTVVKTNSQTGRYILFAHSMGGAIGTLFLEQYSNIFCGAVLSSPMLGMQYGSYPKFVAAILAWGAKKMGKEEEYAFGQHGFDGNSHFETSSCLSQERYEYIFQKRVTSTKYRNYGGTFSWVRAGMQATKKLMKKKNIQKIVVPILLFQAGKDTTVDNRVQNKFAKRCKKVTLVKVKEAKHEIFNSLEATRQEYYACIQKFLNEIS